MPNSISTVQPNNIFDILSNSNTSKKLYNNYCNNNKSNNLRTSKLNAYNNKNILNISGNLTDRSKDKSRTSKSPMQGQVKTSKTHDFNSINSNCTKDTSKFFNIYNNVNHKIDSKNKYNFNYNYGKNNNECKRTSRSAINSIKNNKREKSTSVVSINSNITNNSKTKQANSNIIKNTYKVNNNINYLKINSLTPNKMDFSQMRSYVKGLKLNSKYKIDFKQNNNNDSNINNNNQGLGRQKLQSHFQSKSVSSNINCNTNRLNYKKIGNNFQKKAVKYSYIHKEYLDEEDKKFNVNKVYNNNYLKYNNNISNKNNNIKNISKSRDKSSISNNSYNVKKSNIHDTLYHKRLLVNSVDFKNNKSRSNSYNKKDTSLKPNTIISSNCAQKTNDKNVLINKNPSNILSNSVNKRINYQPILKDKNYNFNYNKKYVKKKDYTNSIKSIRYKESSCSNNSLSNLSMSNEYNYPRQILVNNNSSNNLDKSNSSNNNVINNAPRIETRKNKYRNNNENKAKYSNEIVEKIKKMNCMLSKNNTYNKKLNFNYDNQEKINNENSDESKQIICSNSNINEKNKQNQNMPRKIELNNNKDYNVCLEKDDTLLENIISNNNNNNNNKTSNNCNNLLKDDNKNYIKKNIYSKVKNTNITSFQETNTSPFVLKKRKEEVSKKNINFDYANKSISTIDIDYKSNNNINNNKILLNDFSNYNTFKCSKFTDNSSTISINNNNNKSLLSKPVIKKIISSFDLMRGGYNGPGLKKNNQDNYFYYKNFNGNPLHMYLGICDGHGPNGHNASLYIRTTLPAIMEQEIRNNNLKLDKHFLINQTNKKNIYNSIKEAFIKTNNLLNYKVDTLLSGTTCCSLFFNSMQIISANSGDSRAVLGKKLKVKSNNSNVYSYKWIHVDLTRDHKPDDSDEKERIIKCGGRVEPHIDENGNFIGPSRVWMKDQSLPGLAMSRSMGDQLAASLGTTCEPEIFEYNLEEEDKFILIASDGVWEFISSEDSVNLIKNFYESNDPKGCCEFLLKEASTRWINEENIIDDISMILLFFD